MQSSRFATNMIGLVVMKLEKNASTDSKLNLRFMLKFELGLATLLALVQCTMCYFGFDLIDYFNFIW